MIICYGKEHLFILIVLLETQVLNVLEGKMKLINFDNGKVTANLEMEPLGSSVIHFCIVNKCEWHTMIAISELVLVHEILEGPLPQKNFHQMGARQRDYPVLQKD